MTDELVERLNRADEYEPLGHDGWEAADRIEALTTQLAEDRDARVLMDDRLEQLVSQVDALTSGAAKMLAEQDCDYNRKTNDLIKRHAEQVKALTAERDDALECNEQFFVYNQFLKKRVEKAEAERDRLRIALTDAESYLGKGLDKMAYNILRAALKGDSHE